MACFRPGDRPHLFFKLRVQRRKGEPKGFTWRDYRDLITAAHHGLSAPLVWVWDDLNVHLAPELAAFISENKAWLRVSIKRKLKKIQYRLHLIDGCLAATGLKIEPW